MNLMSLGLLAGLLLVGTSIEAYGFDREPEPKASLDASPRPPGIDSAAADCSSADRTSDSERTTAPTSLASSLQDSSLQGRSLEDRTLKDTTAQDTTVQDTKVKIDPARIYYGNHNAWTRAAVVEAVRIIKATGAWKEIQRKGLKKGDPEYELFKHRAEKEAHEAIEKVARNEAPPYDLVGEVGAIVIQGRVVPDITDEVLAVLAP